MNLIFHQLVLQYQESVQHISEKTRPRKTWLDETNELTGQSVFELIRRAEDQYDGECPSQVPVRNP